MTIVGAIVIAQATKHLSLRVDAPFTDRDAKRNVPGRYSPCRAFQPSRLVTTVTSRTH